MAWKQVTPTEEILVRRPPDAGRLPPSQKTPAAPRPDGKPARQPVVGEELALQIEDLRARVAQAQDVMDSVYEDAQQPDPESGVPNPSLPTIQRWKLAVSTWISLSDRLAEAESKQRLYKHNPMPAQVAIRKKKIVEELMSQYGEGGPQYTLLVDMAASKKVRLEAMEESGAFTTSEYDALAKSLREDIAQLQKYTEATKSESISRQVNEMGVALMGIVARYLEDQPTLWKQILQAVKRAIESGTASGVMAPRELGAPKPVIDGRATEAKG